MPKSLLPLAATLAGLSVIAFVVGALMIGIGFALPAAGGAAPESPGWEDGHPVGLYLMTRFWIGTGSLEKASYYFTSDGRVYVDPQEGFSDEELARHHGRHGTVRGGDGELIFTWSDGKEQRGRLERGEGRGFTWDMGIFAPVEPFDDEKELVGRWEGGSSASFAGTRGATSRSFDLRDDGTFSGGSVATLQSASRESVASAGSSGDHSGTWELDGYALVLEYDDGRTARGVVFPLDDDDTPVRPDRFYFAGTLYKKQG